MGAYKNAMEVLVEEEVDRQIKALPSRSMSHSNRTELVAYALNQLPALYATSERGLDYQLQNGKAKFAPRIKQAVQRAIAAVSRDPIRTYAPLKLQHQSTQLRDVLHQLRLLLKNDEVDLENLPLAVQQALERANQKALSWDSQYQASPNSPNYAAHQPASHRRPPVINPTMSPISPIPAAPPVKKPFPNPENKLEEQNLQQNRSPNRSQRTQPDNRPSEQYGWDDPLYKL
jgi:Late competence development protein ComFB